MPKYSAIIFEIYLMQRQVLAFKKDRNKSDIAPYNLKTSVTGSHVCTCKFPSRPGIG